MSRRQRRLALVTLTLCCALVPVAHGVAETAESGAAATASATTTSEAPPAASEGDRAAASELRALARAWADGGGTYGYPFWEKAGQRWRTGEITASMYREYVTGYRDRLVIGCELLDQVDTGETVPEDVRDLLVDSCEARIDALRSLHESLDEQISRAASTEPSADDVEARERIADLDDAYREALEQSYRDARLALDLSQRTLDAAGLDRLAEDAFI